MRHARGLIELVAALLAFPSLASAGGPSCAPFSDAGRFFGENWDDGAETDGWFSNGASNFSNVTPGLAGTSRAAQHNINGTEVDLHSDASISHTSAQGEVVWVEFRVKFQSGWNFNGGGGNNQTKVLSFSTADGCGSSSGRILITFHGEGGGSTATPVITYYPNYVCLPTHGTGDEDVYGSPTGTVTGGTEYHFVVEAKMATHTNGGYVKVWQDGTQIINATGVSMVPTSGSNNWIDPQIGGPAAGTHSNEKIHWDQIRFTTTNIVSGDSTIKAPVLLP